jgi:hypothetical protein
MGRIRLLLGIALIVIANLRLLALLAEYDVKIDMEDVLRWSPALLVLAGIAGLLRLVSARQSFRGPVLLLAVGAALLLITLEPLRGFWSSFGWLALAGATGWWLVATSRRGVDLVDEDWPREVCVLDNRYKISNARELSNGTVHAIAGGFTLDLRGVEIGSGAAQLDVTAVLGGVDVIVPRTWEVRFDQKKFMGICRNRAMVPTSGQPVVIKSLAVLGGVEIRNDI